MPNNGIGLAVVNTANQQPVIYVGQTATLAFTLTNQTETEVTLVPGTPGTASELDVYMPTFFTPAEMQGMGISLPGWNFTYNAGTEALTLVYAGAQAGSWANGGAIQFQVTGVVSNATPTSDTVQVNFVNLGGNVPAQTTAPLSLNAPPQPGNAKLTDVLQVSLDDQGSVYVSAAGDPLQNMLTLNFKNTAGTPLYNGSAMWSGTPKVTVTFVYGSTSGALAPDNQKTSPPLGSAWNIQAGIRFSEGNDWTAQNPSLAGGGAHPSWVLQPANTNQGIIGTGDGANISFSFAPVISFTPPGHTQMTVQFTGFMKDEHTRYDDAVWTLDIVKQVPPPTRGLVNFFSQVPVYQVTQPNQPVTVALRWTMFDVARVTLLTSYPGMPAVTTNYPNPPAIGYGTGQVVIPGTVQSTAVTTTLQAYDGNGGYLNAMQFTAFLQAQMLVDPRDGKVYPVVQIGRQRWMAANLDYAAPSGSAFYANNAGNEQPYGRLYTLQAAGAGIPAGWRLPSQLDWQTLFNQYASPQAAYTALLAGGTSGFNAQLGGQTDNLGSSTQMASYGFYWTSTPGGSGAVYAGFSGTSRSVNVVATNPGSFLFSVRYVQDVS